MNNNFVVCSLHEICLICCSSWQEHEEDRFGVTTTQLNVSKTKVLSLPLPKVPLRADLQKAHAQKVHLKKCLN